MCSRFNPHPPSFDWGDFTQRTAADFNNDSCDKWVLIGFLPHQKTRNGTATESLRQNKIEQTKQKKVKL